MNKKANKEKLKAEAERNSKEREQNKEREKYIPKFGKQLVIEGIELVGIEPGQFKMGDILGSGDECEKPVHDVTIHKSFWMGKYTITQAQWENIMGNNLSSIKGNNLPVDFVNWYDCKSFCARLSQKTHSLGFRLPSEAEWEYACRAGTTTDYYTGNDESDLEKAGWFYSSIKEPPIYTIQPVGKKLPNDFGLYDMHGNVFEWCEDKWHDNYDGAPDDGSPWLSGESSYRVYRGGHVSAIAICSRSSDRTLFNSPDEPCLYNGFRIVLDY